MHPLPCADDSQIEAGYQMSFTATFNAFQVSGITKAEQHVLTAICTFADKNGLCWPSVETIANRCLSSVRTVQMHINALSAKGLLQRTMRAGRSSLIKVTVPTPATSAPLPPQILHPEPAIEPINTTTAAPPPEPLPAAAMPPSLFPEIPEQPKTAVEPLQAVDGTVALPAPVQAITGQSDAPAPTAHESVTVEPVSAQVIEENPLADVPATLLADLGEVRKAKKKPAKVTRTEAQILKTEAEKAGWTLEQVIVTMICHGWSRFQADWVQHVPPQTRQIGQEAVFKPEVVQPASPSAVARFKAEWAKQKAQILADGARRREQIARLRQ